MKTVGVCVTALLLVAATSFGAPWTSPLLYVNDLDAPTYAPGDLVGQDGWTGAFEVGATANVTQVQAAPGHGYVVYNYRNTGDNVHRVSRDLAASPISDGVLKLSYDGLRTGISSDNAWQYLTDGSNILAYYSMANETAGQGFTIHDPPSGSYTSFGNITRNEWYRMDVEVRLTGAGAGTFDVIGRAADGTIAGSHLDQPFASAATGLKTLNVRTYGRDTGFQLDNIVLERPTDRVRHGDLDALAPGNLVGQAGWQLSANSGSLTSQVTPDTHTGTGNVATVKPSGWAAIRQDLLDVDLQPGTLRYTVDARWDGAAHTDSWAWFALGDDTWTFSSPGSPSTFMGAASSFGFRQHATATPTTPQFFVAQGDGSGTTLSGFTFSGTNQFVDSTWYTFQADLHTSGPQANTYDLTIRDRDTGKMVWGQNGVAFAKDNVDISRLGIYCRDGAGTLSFDNQSLATKTLAPAAAPWKNEVLYDNTFESPTYTEGDLVPQDGWAEVWDSSPGTDNTTQIIHTTTSGQAVYNYRDSGDKAVKAYRDLGGVQDDGVVTLSFDARRVGTPLSTGWFNVMGPSGVVAALGMEVPSSTAGFRVHRWDGTYPSFGSLNWDEWYNVALEMRFTGPDAGAYDVTARRSDGSLAAQLLNEPFKDAGAVAAQFGIRTYGTGSGVEVDNLRLEDGKIVNKIVHGDFDRLAPGTGPDDGAPVGCWATGGGAYAEGGDTSRVSIGVKPGSDPTDLALHVTKSGTGSDPASVQQLFAQPYTEGPHKLILQLDQLTFEGLCGADFGVANGSGVASFANVGLRNEGSPDPGNPYGIRTWPVSGGLDVATWTPGMTYTLRSSMDLQTDTFDLYIRGGEYERWTQIGKQLPFSTAADVQQADRVLIGQYYKPCDAFVDNVAVASSADLPVTTHYTNNFEQYAPNLELLHQNDGWHGYDNNSDSRCRVVTDPVMGNVAAVQSTTDGNDYTHLYQDLDAVADAGTAVFSVDARWTGSGSDYAYFVLGDSGLLTDTGFDSIVGAFGFREGRFLIRQGTGTGNWTTEVVGPATDPSKWYTFVANMNLTGPQQNTWALQIFDKAAGSLLFETDGLAFREDYVDITRFGLFAFDVGATTGGVLYFDNMNLVDTPEPTTLVLLGGGLLAIARRRRRK